MARKLDDVLTMLPGKRRARIAQRAKELRALNELPQTVEPARKSEEKMVAHNGTTDAQTSETTAMLKILALGDRQIEEGKVIPAADAIKRLCRTKNRSGATRGSPRGK